MSSERLKDILYGALELEPGERGGFVEHACANNEALLEEVLNLLRAHEAAGEFLSDEEPTVLIGPTYRSAFPDEIGGRRILGKLGEGGFGVVYLAEQDKPVRKRVAVKVVRAGMGSDQVLARFETERRALELMSHPCIAGVIDAGVTDDALPYFVLEFVDGLSITSYVESSKLSLRGRVVLFQQVCMAVQHAHLKGVIHRDLKPSNVLVEEVDGVAVPKVIDFGIAKAVQGPLSDRTVITRSAQIVGTPQYMSPEQVSFGRIDVDTRSDVYSLGALFYEILCGVPPFEVDRIKDIGPAELERLISEENPLRPSSRVVRSGQSTLVVQAMGQDLRGDLDWIVARAMEKDRARRYQSPAALAADLQRYLDGEAVDAGPPSGLYRLQKLVSRHRIEFAAAGAVAMALVAVVVISLVFATRADRALQTAETELSKYQAISGFTKEMLSGIDPAIARGADTTLFRSVLDQAVERVGESATEQPEVEVELRTTIGQSYRSVGLLDAAGEQLEYAVSVAERHLAAHDPLVSEAKSALAQVYAESERQEEGLGIFEEVYEHRAALYGEAHEGTLNALSNIGAVLNGLGRYEKSYEVQIRVLAGRRSLLGSRHADTMATVNNVATLLDDLNRTAEAVLLFEEVIEYQTETNGEDHPQTLATMNNLAFALDNVGRWQESEQVYRRVLEVKERVLPHGHPSTVITLNNLASLLGSRGQPERAVELLSEAVELSIEGASELHYRTLMLKSNLATNLAKSDRHVEAVDILRGTVENLTNTIGAERPETVASSSQLAAALQTLGELEESITLTTDLLGFAPEALPPNHRLLATIHRTHGQTLDLLGRMSESEPHFLEAARIAEAGYGVGSVRLRIYYEAVIDHYELVGDTVNTGVWSQKMGILPEE